MLDTLKLANSIWPNCVNVVGGHGNFNALGTKKVPAPKYSPEWPKGNKLISPFVYQDDKLVGFCDTKAMFASSPIIVMPYEHIEADFSSIKKGSLQIHAPKATVKKVSWKDSGVEDIPEAQYKFKGCKTVADVAQIEPNYNQIANWNELLSDLENGTFMFSYCYNLTTFDSDLSSLVSGYQMFAECYDLTTFTSDLSSLTNGDSMFNGCSNLTSFTSDLRSLTNGYWMFRGCTNLATFTSDLSSLTDGGYMFEYCKNLTTFTSDLSSLTIGSYMFRECKLDTASIKNIAETINTVTNSHSIHIGIGSTTPSEEEHTYLTQIHNKGWKVYVNGSSNAYVPATSTLDETGETMTTPIPFWAKPEPATEETARYIDENGNFFNILGGQFIYVDDPDTYGMFTCEEDAAAQMRLTPYVKPESETETPNEN